MAETGMQKTLMAKTILTGYVIIPEMDREKIEAALPEHIRTTRAEPGCLKFNITPDKNDPNRYFVYEEFIDQAAFDYHQERSKQGEWAKVTKNMERHFSFLAE